MEQRRIDVEVQFHFDAAVAAEECDIRFMKIDLTGGILQSIVCSGPLLF